MPPVFFLNCDESKFKFLNYIPIEAILFISCTIFYRVTQYLWSIISENIMYSIQSIPI